MLVALIDFMFVSFAAAAAAAVVDFVDFLGEVVAVLLAFVGEKEDDIVVVVEVSAVAFF